MKPPTEEQLNEEVDDGYGLAYEGEPSFIIQEVLDTLKMELDALEVTSEMVTDRWATHQAFLVTMVRHYTLSIEMETEWMDEVDQAAVTHYQQKLHEAEENLKNETEEFEEGRKSLQEAMNHKKRQMAVVADVLRRSYTGHF